MGVITAMTQTTDLESSDIRIYADNDDMSQGGRWQPVPDLAFASKKERNSRKPFDQQQWWDHINKIYRRMGGKGVQDDTTDTLAQTYKLKDTRDPFATPTGPQNPNRESITIANLAFLPSADNLAAPLLLSQVADTKDMKQVGIETFNFLLSATLLHEMCHLTKVLTFLGIIALLIKDFKVRLDPDPTKATAGNLVDITSSSKSKRAAAVSWPNLSAGRWSQEDGRYVYGKRGLGTGVDE
ncbi:hypothetical protein P7C71_g2592, partial [Lecanoromycetidae sp. Uapishka_2]